MILGGQKIWPLLVHCFGVSREYRLRMPQSEQFVLRWRFRRDAVGESAHERDKASVDICFSRDTVAKSAQFGAQRLESRRESPGPKVGFCRFFWEGESALIPDRFDGCGTL